MERYLGRELARMRERTGLTQEQAAQKIGASRSAIVRWETTRGWRLTPRPHNLRALLALYGASEEERSLVFALLLAPAPTATAA